MSPAPPLLDTNVLLRHLLGDVPEQSRRASALLKRVEAGDLRVRITEIVVFETVFTLSRTYKKSPQEIRDAISSAGWIPRKRNFYYQYLE